MKKYKGTADYIASAELADIVNTSIALERPLLIKGEPGTGKTLLAKSISEALDKPLIRWHIKSTTKATEGLYQYDTVQRLNDSRFGDNNTSDIAQYIKLGPLGQAFASKKQAVLLIDEIDKADIEFPNDLLNELDEMSFYIPETNETVKAIKRPVVIITSNAERELPNAFLRRCLFHYIEFPEQALMNNIINVHFNDLDKKLLKQCLAKFYWIREQETLRKKPATSELIDWIKALITGGMDPNLLEKEIPYMGTLVKKEQDLEVLNKIKPIR